MGKKEFVEKFSTDKEFADKVMGLTNLEDAKALVAEEGFDFSDEEISAFLDELNKFKGSSMSDEDLDLAVGGFGSESGLLVGSDAEAFRESLLKLRADGSDASEDGFRTGAGLR